MKRVDAEFNAWAINRPRVIFYNWGDAGGIGFSWGNGNSDPVWSVVLNFGARLASRLPRRA